VQLEAAWALTNLACGTQLQTSALIKAGVPEALFKVLVSPELKEKPELCNQCLWALGNIAGEVAEHRDSLIRVGVLEVLGQLYKELPGYSWDPWLRTQVLRTFTWLMSSLCNGQPPPRIEDVDCAFDFFAQVLTGTEDTKMTSEALWGLCYLLEGGAADEQRLRCTRLLSVGIETSDTPVTSHPVVSRIIKVAQSLSSPDHHAQAVPALRVVAQMAIMSTELRDAALGVGAVKKMLEGLQNQGLPVQIRRQAACALRSIVAASNQAQVEGLLDGDKDSCMSAFAMVIQHDSLDVSRECAWAISSLVKFGDSVLSRLNCEQLLVLLAAALRAELLHNQGDNISQPSTEPDFVLISALLNTCEAVLDYRRSSEAVSGSALPNGFAFRGAYTAASDFSRVAGSSASTENSNYGGLFDVLNEMLQPGNLLPYNEHVHHKADSLLQAWRSRPDSPPPACKRAAVSTGSSPVQSTARSWVSRSPQSSCPFSSPDDKVTFVREVTSSTTSNSQRRRKSHGGA
jgi:hypothetical protein